MSPGVPRETLSRAMPRRRGGRKAKRRHRGGRRHKCSKAAAARRQPKGHFHQRWVAASRPPKWPIRRLWMGAQAQMVFQRPCARPDAPALLATAAADLAGRLRGIARHDRNPDGRLDVTSDILGHFCRRRWRLHRANITATLTLLTNRTVEPRPSRTCGSKAPRTRRGALPGGLPASSSPSDRRASVCPALGSHSKPRPRA